MPISFSMTPMFINIDSISQLKIANNNSLDNNIRK